MKKIICLLLVLIMTAIPLISCKDSTDGEGTGTQAPAGTDTDSTGTDTEKPVEKLEIPEGIKFDHDFVMLSPKTLTYNYAINDFDEPSEDAYENALYKRNLAVEELLGITISEVQNDLGGNVQTAFKTSVDAGSGDYDVCFNNMPSSCTALSSDLLLPLDQLDYLDLSKSWWNADATNQLALGGTHYMGAGDIMLGDKECLWAVYFIKSFIEDIKDMPNPYDLVANNEWTWDIMMEMATNAVNDDNGDGAMTTADTWGLSTHGENYAASWMAAGLKIIDLDAEGIPYISFGTEQFTDVHAKIVEIMGNADVVSPSDIGFITTALKEGRTLFGTEVIAFVRAYRDNEPEFGILPYPKYNSDVDRYYSYVAVSAMVMTVGKDCQDTERTSVILEAMAAKGQEILMPDYYESQIKSRYARDEESSECVDIIFKNRAYDLGVFFDWGGAKSSLSSATANPATLYTSLQKAVNKSISKVLTKLGIS